MWQASYIHSVKKVLGIDHSKPRLKRLSKTFLTLSWHHCLLYWRGVRARSDLVCSQCSMLSVHLKCVSGFSKWIRISNKEFVSNFALQMNFVCGIAENVTESFWWYGSGRLFSLSKTQITTSRHPFSVDRRHKKEFAARTEVDSGKCV